MSQIMNAVFQLLSLILSLVAILGIFLFTFTIIGMRLYGRKYVHGLCIVALGVNTCWCYLYKRARYTNCV